MKILVIEDEPELSADMVQYLAAQHYRCETAFTFEEAMEKVDVYGYDCILLDLMLPGGDGMRILEHLRSTGKSGGLIIISAKNALEDKVLGLKLGADDYLAKPFHLPELAARIFSVVRRNQFGNSNLLKEGALKVDLAARSVYVEEEELSLTKSEFDLLVYFLGNANRVISKSAIAENLNGDMADLMDSHDFVYAHVKNLKKKLTDAGQGGFIKTVYGTGYKWER